ncbi:protein-glutamate O-methyltransferase CheR [Yoonia sp.]|uniref:CheR family methyltransferase n=1 Tax=Yoonia sp. TaxID=2212373 RepID=UPI001A0B9181|nr:protein-glutamate O-methyltransferase [Yoonia sp.]MBE0413992.1 protein-glutamate O-methyltransferase [Yoonia sp.]
MTQLSALPLDVSPPQAYAFSDADFTMIAELANRKFGLHLQTSKKALVYSRLARRLRALQMDSFNTYCAFIQTSKGETEHPHLLSALTTNVTHFFREMHHFDALRHKIMPELIEKAQAGRSIRLWSSACSSGQEAYCMAATILDAFPDAQRHDIKVLATDVDAAILGQARAARYPNEQLNAIPPVFRDIMVSKIADSPDHFTVQQNVRAIVTFGQLNLIEAWPMKRKFDVIFCRNAAIYFDKDTQSNLWARFEQALTPGGYLMIGHSERLSGPAAQHFKSTGITTYQKINTTA